MRKNRQELAEFERNEELVRFLNSFADPTLPLPAGWETARGQAGQQVGDA